MGWALLHLNNFPFLVHCHITDLWLHAEELSAEFCFGCYVLHFELLLAGISTFSSERPHSIYRYRSTDSGALFFLWLGLGSAQGAVVSQRVS
jgi:hypothetical protein